MRLNMAALSHWDFRCGTWGIGLFRNDRLIVGWWQHDALWRVVCWEQRWWWHLVAAWWLLLLDESGRWWYFVAYLATWSALLELGWG